MKRDPLGPKIKALREQGYSYNKIAQTLDCSKATISYHLGPGQKEKVRERGRRLNENNPNALHKKRVWHFKHPRIPTTKTKPWYQHRTKRQISKAISQKAHQFQKTMTFNYHDVHAKYGDHFQCSLTGRPLDWNNPSDYQYDHKVPIARGGDNTINNLQILCTEANQAKGHLTDEEFIELCKEIIQHQGYKIWKPVHKTTGNSD